MSSYNAAAEYDMEVRNFPNPTSELYATRGETLTNARWRGAGPGTATYNPNVQSETRSVPFHGLMRPLGSHTSGITPSWSVNLRSAKRDNLDFLYNVDPDHDFGSAGSDNAQSAISAAAGTAFDFDEGADGAGVLRGDRVDLLDASGNRVMHVTSVTLAGTQSNYGATGSATALLEGTDFEVDYLEGQILFLRDIADDVITPTFTAPAITSASELYLVKRKPFLLGSYRRHWRVLTTDQDERNPRVVGLYDFFGELAPSGSSQNDGSAAFEGQYTLTYISGGYLYTRSA